MNTRMLQLPDSVATVAVDCSEWSEALMERPIQEVFACLDGAGDVEWALRPLAQPWRGRLGLDFEDAEALRLWARLRADWSEVLPVATEAAPAVEVSETLLSWWISSVEFRWLLAGLGLAGVLFVAAYFAWKWSRPRADGELVRRSWPEFEVLERAILRGEVGAVVDVAVVGVRNRLVPTEEEGRKWVWPLLNSKEQECAEYIIQGLAPNDIAQMMHCTPKHIYNLRSHIRRRLNLSKDADLEKALRELTRP